MAMTGTGTSADPFVPSTYAEFKTACETSGAYISMPTNGEWDLNEQYSSGVPAITFNNCHIAGNGFTMRNIYAENINTFSGTAEISSMDFPGINQLGGAFIHLSSSGDSFANCRFSGQLTDAEFIKTSGYNYNATFRQCSFNFKLSGSALFCTYGNYTAQPKLYYSNVKLVGTTSASCPFQATMYQGSQLEGNLTSTNSGYIYLSENSTLSKVNIGLSGFSAVTGYNPSQNPIVVNSSIIDNATVYSNFISATAEQMKDADWLTEHGFPAYAAS